MGETRNMGHYNMKQLKSAAMIQQCFKLFSLCCILSFMVSCASPKQDYHWPQVSIEGNEQAEIAEGVQADPLPKRDNSSSPQKPIYFTGNGEFFQKGSSRIPHVERGGDEGFNLNFSDVDIRTVVGAILGDILGRQYFVDPNVQGTLSLQTSNEIHRDALLPILESALRTKGLAIVDVNGVMQVVPLAEAPRRIASSSIALPASANRPGFGVQVVPLRYTSPVQMRQLLEPFAPPNGILRVDESRNMLIIAGTRQELAAMLQTIETFDVDWLAGMSFAMFNVQYVEAETLAKELLQIFGDPQSPIAGLVRLIPIQRLNAILAVSPQAGYLKEVETWISRFDIGGATPGRKIYVYNVKNGRAGDLASALGRILGSRGIGGSDRQPPHSVEGDRNTETFTLGRPSQPADNERTVQQAPNVSPNVSLPNDGDNAFEAGGLRIVPNEENNSLLILATPSEFSVVETALKQMDIPPRQVLIEATLIEVTLTDELRYGVQWLFEPGDNTITQSQAGNGSIASQFPGFSYVFSGASDARVVLNALESLTDVNVLFAPKLLVLNNQSATLQVGDQVPVPVQTAVSTNDTNAPIVNSIQFRDTGVILSVTPRINEGGLVLIDIEQEVSDVVQTTSSGIDAPTIQQRKINSTVAVQSGDTIALGGLIRENTSRGKSGVPVLSRIPLIGAAFGAHNNTLRRTELIVLITPRIARDARETGEIMKYLREQFRALKPNNAE